MIELSLISVKDKKINKISYFCVDDKSYDAILASGGSNLDETHEWNWLGDVEISEETLNRKGYFHENK